jgi:ABC-2 type transport system permease protein
MGTIMLTALSVAREREQGTFDQLLVTPFRPFEIMIGKAIPNLIIGLAQATTILLIAQFWFRIPFIGSFLVLYAGLTLFLMAAVGRSVRLLHRQDHAAGDAIRISSDPAVCHALRSDDALSSMPSILQSAMIINPLRYSLDLTKRVYLEGAGFTNLLSDFLPLLVIGLVTLSGAAWLFRRRLT